MKLVRNRLNMDILLGKTWGMEEVNGLLVGNRGNQVQALFYIYMHHMGH